MPANCGRSAARLVVLVLLVLLVSGCGGQTDESTAAGQATTSTTVAPTTTAVPRLTAQELAWLKAVTRLQQRMEKAFEKQSGMRLTRAKMVFISCSAAAIETPGFRRAIM